MPKDPNLPSYHPKPLPPDQIQALIDRTGKPLAYIEGFAYFYGRKFTVSPAILIPRPETEAIIEVAKDLVQSGTFLSYATTASLSAKIAENLQTSDLGGLSKRGLQTPTSSRSAATVPCEDRRARETTDKGRWSEGFRILDLGTGSGAIAITLALELPHTEITATDISPSALAIARQNARHHKTQIHFKQQSLLSGSDPTQEKYDIICANLPYVDPTWPWLDLRALSHEPALALYAKDHGLELIKKLIQQAPHHLNPDGRLILEHDPTQLTPITAYAKNHNLTPTPHTPYVTSFTLKTNPSSPPHPQNTPTALA